MNRSSVGTLTFGIILIAVSLVACMEEPLQPRTAPLGTDAGAPARALEQPVIQSVTGNGHFVSDEVGRTSDFSMRKHADGTVDGWYHALDRGPGGGDIRVRIECLHVVGNQAWASGIVVAAANPDNIGRPYSFHFVDNGEGKSAGRDLIGVARFEAYDCTTEPDLSLRELTVGNLQVRN